MNVQEPPERFNTSDESAQSEESQESEQSENEAAESLPDPVPDVLDPLETTRLSRDRCLSLKQKLKAAYRKLKKAHDDYEKDHPGERDDSETNVSGIKRL